MCCCYIPVLEQGRNAFNTRLSMVIQSHHQASQIGIEMTSHMFGQGRHDVFVRRRLPMFSTVFEDQRTQHQLLNPVWLAALALRAFCNVFRLHYKLYPLRPVTEFLGSAGRLFARFIRLLRDLGFHLLMNAAGHQLGPLGKILQNVYLIRQRLQFLTKLGNDFHQIAQLLLFRFQLLAQLSIFLSQARVELVSSAPARHTIFGLDSGTTWIHLLSDSAPNFKLGGNRHRHQADLRLRQHHLSPNQDNALRSAWINCTVLSKLTFMPQFHIFYRFMI